MVDNLSWRVKCLSVSVTGGFYEGLYVPETLHPLLISALFPHAAYGDGVGVVHSRRTYRSLDPLLSRAVGDRKSVV